MRIGEMLRFLRAFYPSWDDGYAEELRQRFDLDAEDARIKTLSQGVSVHAPDCWRQRKHTAPSC